MNAEVDVWIVWVDIVTTKEENVKIFYGKIKPKVGAEQKGVAGRSIWTFLATIKPESIVVATQDVPDLRGVKTQDVPGAANTHIGTGKKLAGGADKKWDVSRRHRTRIKSPVVSTDDHPLLAGKGYDGLPNANIIQEDYPTDDAIGNDDMGTTDEDNNPYSDAEEQPLKEEATPKGKLASADVITNPVFREGAGANDDTYEMHIHFGEFVRLQIGDSNSAKYRNWYRVSDFAPFRHVVILKKVAGSWVDNEKKSLAEPNNNGW